MPLPQSWRLQRFGALWQKLVGSIRPRAPFQRDSASNRVMKSADSIALRCVRPRRGESASSPAAPARRGPQRVLPQEAWWKRCGRPGSAGRQRRRGSDLEGSWAATLIRAADEGAARPKRALPGGSPAWGPPRLISAGLASCGVAPARRARLGPGGLLITVMSGLRPAGPGPSGQIWESNGRPAGFPAGHAGVVVPSGGWWPMIQALCGSAQRALAAAAEMVL